MADQLVWTLSVAERVWSGKLGHCFPEPDAPFHVTDMNWWERLKCSRPHFYSPWHICIYDFFCLFCGLFLGLAPCYMLHCPCLLQHSFLCGSKIVEEVWGFCCFIVWERKVWYTVCQERHSTFCPHLNWGNSTQIPVVLHWKQKTFLVSFLNNLTKFKKITALPRIPPNPIPLNSNMMYFSYCRVSLV